jgi:hypothetical protein
MILHNNAVVQGPNCYSGCIINMKIAISKRHLDYSFALTWHPNSQLFVIQNQHMTTHLWEIKILGSSLIVNAIHNY